MHWLDKLNFEVIILGQIPWRPDQTRPRGEAISTLQPQSNAFESPNSEIISTFLFYSNSACFYCLSVFNYLIRLCLLLNYVLMIELLETMPIPATNDDVNEWYQSQIYAQEPLHWTCFPFNNQTTAIPPEQQHLPPPTHFLILLHLFVCVRTTSDDSSAHFTSELHYSAFLHYSRSNWLLIIGIISI